MKNADLRVVFIYHPVRLGNIAIGAQHDAFEIFIMPYGVGGSRNRFSGFLHHRADPQDPRAINVGNEIHDIGVVGFQEDALRFALLYDGAILQDHQVVCQLQGFIKIVRDENDGFLQLWRETWRIA